ncbi:MAG: hypothetical protein QW076_06055 [Candidatus Anstonellales archaeon]
MFTELIVNFTFPSLAIFIFISVPPLQEIALASIISILGLYERDFE